MDYNDEEVEYCNACKSLFIVEDEYNNVWCRDCDSLNHTSKCKNIFEYEDKIRII